MSQKNSPNLQQQIQKFDEIVAWFGQDDLDIDAAIARYEEGRAVADEIRKTLDTLENKITVLKTKFDLDV